jgi:cardiolipin synthase
MGIAEAERAETVRTAQHSITLFSQMDQLFDDINDKIRSAQRRVWIETFIYRSDRAGHALVPILADAVRRGVDVRLLYDPLGCRRTLRHLFEGLSRQGVRVRAYRPLRTFLKTLSVWPRDHTRVVLLDDCAYTGGMAWGEEWLTRKRGGHGWRDVCLRAVGPCVQDFVRVFKQRWVESCGDAEPSDYATRSRYPDVELVTDTPEDRLLVLARHCDRINRARSRVWMEMSYFLPPVEMLDALYSAAGRGVDVRLILPYESDLPIFARAARDEYGVWLDRGLKLFEYRPNIVHAKYAIVDDDWSAVGTFNANLTSVLFANEICLLVLDPRFVVRMAQMFLRDLAQCTPVDEQRLRERGLSDQLKDTFCNLSLRALDAFVTH